MRNTGGGRKQTLKKNPKIEETFLSIMKDHTTGDPQQEDIIWTDLSCTEILERLKGQGIEGVGRRIVKELLKKHGYKKRKIMKRLSMGEVCCRNEQFENIATLTQDYKDKRNPIVSCDAKKKEPIGNRVSAKVENLAKI